jgi:hypothetical protein
MLSLTAGLFFQESPQRRHAAGVRGVIGVCLSNKETHMRDWLSIGATPPSEDCAQVGSDGYMERARHECRAYIDLLRRSLGEEPDGAVLRIRSDQHDFGTYLTVVCYFEDGNEAAIDYALRCESKGPEEWDDAARKELGISENAERK